MSGPLSRGAFVASAAGVVAVGGLAGRALAAPAPVPEKSSLRLGLAVGAMSFLPVYVAQARTWKAAGLDVEMLAFRGDAEVAQALAGDSIDVSIASLNGLINLIKAGQPCLAFYGGFGNADFSWLASRDVKNWSDLKGRGAGISTYGSLTDALTRYVLNKHGLAPEKDVPIVQIGGTPATYQALLAGRIGLGILSPPFGWQAQDAGYTLLATQPKDVAPSWPKHVISAKSAFIAANPRTCEAFLRAHVAGIRLARADRELAVGIMVDQMKLAKPMAERAYDVEMPFYDERGGMPEKSMPVFWEITKQLGDVDAPWPENKYLDHRFINSFAQWAP